MTIAQTILEQLGGHRFLRMTGAKDLIGGETYLSMKLPSSLTKSRITHLRVTLDADDTYTLEALRWSRKTMAMTTVSGACGVYCDGLAAMFTDLTGLYTRLGA